MFSTQEKADTEIKQYFVNFRTLKPPTYLKLGTLLEVNQQQKEIQIAGSTDLSIGYMLGGVASNVKADKFSMDSIHLTIDELHILQVVC